MQLDKNGTIGTIITMSILLAILLFAGFSTPLPLPAEQGILINFGDVQYAASSPAPKVEKKVEKQPEPQPVKPVATPEPVEEQVATQDFEDAPAIATPKKVEKKKPEEKKTEKVEEKVEEKPVEKKEPTVNKNALYRRSNNPNNSGSDGNAQGQGDMGSQTGSKESDNYQQGLSSGDGISFSLAGRNPLSLPTPEFNHQKEGKVVVEVTVDRSGRVTNAVPGVKGSTTLDSYLLNAAKKAALASKFTSKDNAPFYQKGTITYYFKLR